MARPIPALAPVITTVSVTCLPSCFAPAGAVVPSLLLPGMDRSKRGSARSDPCSTGQDRLPARGAGGTATAAPRVLREYALVADGERGALIGPDGSVAWLCVPRWDSPAVFSGLLGGPGRYTITPADPWHVWGGYYENGSLIWRSRWVGDTRIECREALAMPADPHRAVLLRRIEAIDGAGEVTVSARPAGRLRARPDDRPEAAGRDVDRAQRRHLVPLVGRGRRRGSPTAGSGDDDRAGGRERSTTSFWRSPIVNSPVSRPTPTGLGGDRGGLVGCRSRLR